MRVLLVGATGLIGSSAAPRLVRAGHQVTGVARRPAPGLISFSGWHRVDIARATPEEWSAILAGIDVVVNCTGVLQDTPGNTTTGVHLTGAATLYEACEQAGVRRVIHLSAIGVDRETPSDFSATKQAAEADLMGRDLDWVILRPSVVLGRRAYGGSALFRGLGALPVNLVLPDAGSLQVVQLDQVVETILFFVRPDAPSRVALDLAGPERLSFDEVTATYRRWLGQTPARRVALPRWLTTVLAWGGDLVRWLGWQPPLGSTAMLELKRGAIGDPSEWTRMTGIAPLPLAEALAAEPAAVQEQWFANLYFLKPAVIGVLALFWLVTGFVALGPGYAIGTDVMAQTILAPLGPVAIFGGAGTDLLVGAGIAFRRTSRLALLAGIAVSLLYALIGTILIPAMWADPLGPMLKIWPIIVLHVVALAILRDR